MQLRELVRVSNRVAATGSRREKTRYLADLLRRLDADEIALAVSYLTGELPQGRIGVGPSTLGAARPDASAAEASLDLDAVDSAVRRIDETEGRGSRKRRRRLLADLLMAATAEEQEFLGRLLLGELRQGALEGLMTEAVAEAADARPEDVRRAVMLSGELPSVARVALVEGAAALREFAIELFRPLRPMLAETAEGVAEALDELGEAALEYKLDGVRIQAHRDGPEVRVFTRQLNDVTGSIPEVVEAVGSLPAEPLVLDGEVLALREDGTPHAFQTTMRRFGRKGDVDEMRRTLPLSPRFFDLLHLRGEDLIDRPARERYRELSRVVPEGIRIPRILPETLERGEAFLDAALDDGHEGLVAKSLEAPYEAGRRGRVWLKIKPAHTLDLVILAAEWGHGRRRGWLSNLHLGARDPDGDGFVMLGKTFKGLTDRMLAWQTEKLQELEVSREDDTVFVRPELVAEVAFDEVQSSPRYPAGVALRFARVVRYRRDLEPEQADSLDRVLEIHRRRGGG